MNKRLGAIATLVTAVAAAAGLFARPSIGAANNSTDGYCKVPWCIVALTGTGPSPSDVKMDAANYLEFSNPDSVAHTVVFANGLCSLTVSLGTGGAPHQWADCKDNFSFYAGSYAYTVDGKFPGKVVTTPLRRLVTLTAREQSIRRGARLRLHGQVIWHCGHCGLITKKHYFPVIVLARHNTKDAFEPIATVPQRFEGRFPGRWKLTVRPGETTAYIAKVTGQLPQGRIWTSAKSRPFTVRIRH
jgi:hypothetical protein